MEHLSDSMERAAIGERALECALQLQARFYGVRRVCLTPVQTFKTVRKQQIAFVEETGEARAEQSTYMLPPWTLLQTRMRRRGCATGAATHLRPFTDFVPQGLVCAAWAPSLNLLSNGKAALHAPGL